MIRFGILGSTLVSAVLVCLAVCACRTRRKAQFSVLRVGRFATQQCAFILSSSLGILQGREKHFIIFSCVRSSPRLGFLNGTLTLSFPCDSQPITFVFSHCPLSFLDELGASASLHFCERSLLGSRASFPQTASDVRRLNVALTRAQYGMYVVGNAEALQNNATWKVCWGPDQLCADIGRDFEQHAGL